MANPERYTIDKVAETLTDHPTAVIVSFVAVFGFLFTFCLCAFHTHISRLRVSTYEYLKRTYSNMPYSPFSLGNGCSNFFVGMICKRKRKSFITNELYLKSKGIFPMTKIHLIKPNTEFKIQEEY